MEKQTEELKEEIKRELNSTTKDEEPEKLRLIDSIQRLGVCYHFEYEINKILEQLHHITITSKNNGDDHPYNMTLRFRLLRQQGYNISSSKFVKLTLTLLEVSMFNQRFN